MYPNKDELDCRLYLKADRPSGLVNVYAKTPLVGSQFTITGGLTVSPDHLLMASSHTGVSRSEVSGNPLIVVMMDSSLVNRRLNVMVEGSTVRQPGGVICWFTDAVGLSALLTVGCVVT